MGTDTTKADMILGCDIGNAYGYVSILQDAAADPLPLLPGRYHLDMGMPTQAFLTPPDGRPIEVFRAITGKPISKGRKNESYVRAIKTRLEEGSIHIPGINGLVDTDEIYGAIAKELIALANEALPLLNIPPVYNVVFTFPASMADKTDLLDRMQKSIESVSIDGQKIHVAGRLPEPAAVAIDYLYYMQHVAPQESRITDDHFTVLVYDLGYGTFDTAVVTASSAQTPYVLHSKDGSPEVGGKDFDRVIYDEFCRILSEKYNYHPGKTADYEWIMEAAVKAKHELSDNESSVQNIMLKDDYYEVELSRERFEQLSQELLNETLILVQNMLDNAKEKGIPINAIVLSGGSSLMPMIRQALEELAEGEYPIVLYRPSEAVSFGASRYAWGISGQDTKKGSETESTESTESKETTTASANPVLEQMTDCCYGVWSKAEGNLKGEVTFLIPTEQKRPAVSQPIYLSSNSSRLTIQVYRLKELNKNLQKADKRDCESVQWFTFDVSPGEEYEVRIRAEEDYSIVVELKGKSGTVMKAGTNDSIV